MHKKRMPTTIDKESEMQSRLTKKRRRKREKFVVRIEINKKKKQKKQAARKVHCIFTSGEIPMPCNAMGLVFTGRQTKEKTKVN